MRTANRKSSIREELAEAREALRIALAREAAIRQFCQVEMEWEFFRDEFQIGDSPSKSRQNAMRLRQFLSANPLPPSTGG